MGVPLALGDFWGNRSGVSRGLVVHKVFVTFGAASLALLVVAQNVLGAAAPICLWRQGDVRILIMHGVGPYGRAGGDIGATGAGLLF